VARGAVLALEAGVDLVLISHRLSRQRAGLDAARAALASGALDPAALSAAAERVLRLKRRALSWDDLPNERGLATVGVAAHREVAARAYTASATLARDEAGLVPLRLAADERLLVVARHTKTITRAVDIGYAPAALVDAIQGYHPRAEALTLPADAGTEAVDAAVRATRGADAVVLVTLNAHLDPMQREMLRRCAAAGREAGRKVVGLAVCDPYDAGALPEIPTFLLTYEYSPPALEAAARALFGAVEPRGRAPATLVAYPIPS
jgi:beta-N-acetylhexosaminidase